jgi:hypothetical protein
MPIDGVSELMNAKGKKGKGKRVVIITMCVWCGMELKRQFVHVDDENEADPMVSHGICKSCERKVMGGK